MMNSIIRLLKNSHAVLIATHANPDGDAISSLLAMGLALASSKKKITLYTESPIPAVYRFLPTVDQVVHQIDVSTDYDTAVILDCSDLERIGEAVSLVAEIPVVINVDHHITNTFFGDFQLIDTAACATTEILFHIIKAMNIPFDKAIATAIYTGILTDTGSFRFSNTNRAAFSISEEMIKLGVDPYEIAQHVYGTYSLGRMKLLNLALESIEISRNGKLSMMTLTQNMLTKTGTQSEDVDGMINYARRIEDIKVAVLIQENPNGSAKPIVPNQYHVSLRSDGTVDVAEIATAFGGGGHFSAAGFSMEATLDDLKSRIFLIADRL
ncbi:bifunctional oligoribonuclease/PAP phosphatase NrnA [Thermodesulfobacteriota bacterium]